MAFFKFRQHSAAPAKKPPRKADAASAPPDSIESVRRRARHRLIGAVVLVALAVVGFPLLFDTEPRPAAVNAPITIPDRDHAPPLTAPKPVGQAAVPAAASLGEHEEVVPPASKPATQATATPATETTAPTRAAAGDAAKPPATPAAQAARDDDAKARREQEAQARAKAQHDEQQAKAQREADAKARREAEAARARAALEGRASAKPATAATASATDAGRFIVQIGAFAEADSAQQARRKAEGAGLKTYTQVVSTADGKRTRVRVGPFASRAEAEKAAAALKKAGLPGSILTL
ncbi:MAG: SPOR domain-containing protein [Burkholderiales bacterium]|nr:SPOR domain-containing protein [Burkholderiales bacterium]MBS0400891.1 SPOR domain-containing protein [Pseudomonadota bacterium]MBS0413231.1 SPOR domain-containing protein [Pseudomonadota bacterium]